MDAQELFTKDGSQTGIHYCVKCKKVYTSHEEAEKCCQPILCSCGNIVKQHYTICENCYNKKELLKEQNRFDKARKEDASTYSGWVCYNDKYYANVDDLIEDLECDGLDIPAYVWGCKATQYCMIDANKAIDNGIQYASEDNNFDIEGIFDFKSAVEKFNEANKDNILYDIDYSVAIIIKGNNG